MCKSSLVTSLVLLCESTGQGEKSLSASSIISTCVTSKEFVFYFELLEEVPPGLWYLVGVQERAVVSAHEMPQKELALQKLPIPACPM